MPVPTTTTPRQDLAGAFFQFDPAANGFVAEQILPIATVAETQGEFGIVPFEAFTQDLGSGVRRTPGSEFARTTWQWQSDSFKLVPYGLEEAVDMVNQRVYRTWDDALGIAAQRIRAMLAIAQERRVAAKIFNETTFPPSGRTGATLTNPWDVDAGTPIKDVQAGVNILRDRVGNAPISLLIGRTTHVNLSQNPDIIERLINTTVPGGLLPAATLAALLGVDQIIVAGGVFNNANPGAASESPAQIWSSDYAMLFVQSRGAAWNSTLGLGRTLRLDTPAPTIETYYQNTIDSEVVRIKDYSEEKIIYPQCAYLIKNTAS